MASSSPSRVLGSADTSQPYSDNPYSPTPQDHPEVDSLAPANERTSLLSSSSPSVRKKAGPRAASARSDPAILNAAGEGDEDDLPPTARVVRRRPWSLKLDFGVACVLLCMYFCKSARSGVQLTLYSFTDANFSLLLLCVAAINSPFIAHNALPPHRGSMFVPIWVTLLSTITNVYISTISFLTIPLANPPFTPTASPSSPSPTPKKAPSSPPTPPSSQPSSPP
jgi:hypothetical protein